MDKEIWSAIQAKFDPVRAKAALTWVGEVCEEAIPEQGNKSTADWFAVSFFLFFVFSERSCFYSVFFKLTLKDGYFLTKLMLTLHPDVKNNIRAARKWKPKHEKMAVTCQIHR